MNTEMLERVQNKYRKLTNELIEKNIRISTMESCTAGLISSLITDTEGASAIFPGAAITYSNEEKVSIGLEASFLKQHSVYSPETAREMAKTIRTRMHTELGIGVTGCFANPDAANPEGIPGVVYYEILGLSSSRFGIIYTGIGITRFEAKLTVAERIADETMELLKENAE